MTESQSIRWDDLNVSADPTEYKWSTSYLSELTSIGCFIKLSKDTYTFAKTMDESTDEAPAKKQYEFVSRWLAHKDRFFSAHLLRTSTATRPLHHSLQTSRVRLSQAQGSPEFIKRAIIRFTCRCLISSATTTEPWISRRDVGASSVKSSTRFLVGVHCIDWLHSSKTWLPSSWTLTKFFLRRTSKASRTCRRIRQATRTCVRVEFSTIRCRPEWLACLNK